MTLSVELALLFPERLDDELEKFDSLALLTFESLRLTPADDVTASPLRDDGFEKADRCALVSGVFGFCASELLAGGGGADAPAGG